MTMPVIVTSGAAVQLNFTLVEDTINGWSQKEDFNLKNNLHTKYMDGLSVVQEIKNIAHGTPEAFR